MSTAKQTIANVIDDETFNPTYTDALRYLRNRSAFDNNLEAQQLAAVAFSPKSRERMNMALDVKWSTEATSSKLEDIGELVIGGGVHAAIYCASRVAAGFKPPTVITDGPVGGAFATSARPAFYLNSGNKPGKTGLPGSGSALNYLPGAPLQSSQISMGEYETNADIAFCARLALAKNAHVYSGRIKNIDPLSGAVFREVQLENGDTLFAKRVIIATGLGECRRPDYGFGGTRDMSEVTTGVLTFADYLKRLDSPFPLKGVKRLAVIGGGDSGKVAVESVLGIGPSLMMTSSALDYVQRIDWYGITLPTSCDEWKTNIRGRYARIGTYLPPQRNETDPYERDNDGDAVVSKIPPEAGDYKRLRVYNERGNVVPTFDGALVNGRPYDMVIFCGGYEAKSIVPSSFNWTSYGPGSSPIAAKYDTAGEIFRIGPANDFGYDPSELREDYARISENRTAIFRWANRTAALATVLDKPGINF